LTSWKCISNVDSGKLYSKTLKLFTVFCILFIIGLVNVLHVSSTYSSKKELHWFSKSLSWMLLCKYLISHFLHREKTNLERKFESFHLYAMFSVIMPAVPVFSTRRLIIRILNIYFCLGIVSFLFSLTHDALFLPLFCVHLLIWLLLENIRDTSPHMKYFGVSSECRYYNILKSYHRYCEQFSLTLQISQLFDIKFSQIHLQKRHLQADDFRRAYVFVSFMMIS